MRVRSQVLSLVAVLWCAPALAAQGVIVHSVSDVQLYGAFGTMARIAARMGGGKMPHNTPTTTTVSGHRLRSESDRTATIIDADAGTFTELNFDKKAYTTMTFEEMAAAMKAAADSMDAARSRAKAEQAKNPKTEKTDVTVHFKATVDRTGEHETIAGYTAERVFLTLTGDVQATPDDGSGAQNAGSFVFLFEEWLSKDAPQLAAMREFQKAYAKKAGQAFQDPLNQMASSLAGDPKVKAGFEQAAKELQKLDGAPLRNTAYVVLVPPNVTFDRNLVVGGATANAAAPEPKKSRFGRLAGAVKSAAESKVGAGKSESKEKEPPKQSTVMSVSDVVQSIEKTSVPASTFAPPAGFTKVERPVLSGKK